MHLSQSTTKRRLLAAAIVVGMVYWLGSMGRSGIAFPEFADWPKPLVIALKATATGLLVAAAWVAATTPVRRLLAISLSVIWVADIVLAVRFVVLAGMIFVVAHVIAITAYAKVRDPRKATPPYLILSASVPVVGMAWLLFATQGTEISLLMSLFPAFSLVSAAVALQSRYPLWSLGAGTVIFSLSDIVGVMSLTLENGIGLSWLVWLTYFAGLSLIVWTLIQAPEPENPQG